MTSMTNEEARDRPGQDAAATAEPASPDRAEVFRRDIAAMRLHDPVVKRDRVLRALGVLAMVAGVVTGIVAIVTSSGTSNPLTQRDAIVIALFGVVLTVIGGVLFLRYSLAHFMRFWMARLTFEQAAQTDRLIEAVGGDHQPEQP